MNFFKIIKDRFCYCLGMLVIVLQSAYNVMYLHLSFWQAIGVLVFTVTYGVFMVLSVTERGSL